MIDLKNDHLKGVNNYPLTFFESFPLMLNCDAKKIIADDDEDDVLEISMSHWEAAPITGTDREFPPAIACRKCKKMGHCANNFPEQEMKLC